MGVVWVPPEMGYYNGSQEVLFLAGPIQGAPDWQAKAIEYIHNKVRRIPIANPRREIVDHNFNFDEQVEWETHFLKRAARFGVILFWLAKEEIHSCDRAYGQTSRFELAEWIRGDIVQGRTSQARLVVGIEDGFSGAKYIKYRLKNHYRRDYYTNFEETCQKAIQMYLEH